MPAAPTPRRRLLHPLPVFVPDDRAELREELRVDLVVGESAHRYGGRLPRAGTEARIEQEKVISTLQAEVLQHSAIGVSNAAQ